MKSILTVRNPYDGAEVRTVPLLSDDELDQVIAVSQLAFENVRRIPAYKRAALLRGLADAVSADADRFANAIMREAGKPISQAQIEVQRAAGTLSGSADEAIRIAGETIPLDTAPPGTGRFGITRRFPKGPVAAISPFNFPLNLGMHKVGPALAAGCSVLWKPPLQAPGAALLFAELFSRLAGEQGFDEHALQVVVCEDQVAEKLVTDERVRVLSFTGSGRVGWDLRSKAGSKAVTLELGGNAAVIVGADADLDFAAKRSVEGGFAYAGQVCIAVQRVLVPRPVMEEFSELLVTWIDTLVVGDPAIDSTQVGPMISVKEVDRVESWIREAAESGATVIAGGVRRGQFISPTLVGNVDSTMKIVAEEVFGPVLTLQPYSDWSDALAMANDSQYGLQAGIFTSDLGRILDAFETLETGAVVVGDIPTVRFDAMPYGGVKRSGFGREGMRYAMEDMMDERLLILPPSSG